MKKFSLLIMIVLILVLATSCKKQVFDGNRTGNNEQFIMDYSVLNKTDTQEMDLEEGTIIDVIIEDESGRVDILVAEVDGDEIYRGDDASSISFSLEVPKTGTYKFSVTGTNAKGSVSFKVRK
ncbi:hypothetical protein [Anaerocolumna aminovalerica]|jgi:hypothetical protein|uniref:hypothetical protein n=1 Tax=Anaerocolumna aminovalerica TaxID=1527 RepID=UPI001C0EFB37|nr:hypothetical protein [Anaerocolumna aminovalerica]MBU5334621.1 hypothetical protein [Anaerocolumna aminovalerica]